MGMQDDAIPHYKTCKRWNNESDAHCLTFSCFRLQKFLSRPRACQWLLDSIQQARERLGFHLWAYVIMPQHVHMVIWPQTVPIDVILKAVKLPVTKKALRWVRQEAPAFLPQMADVQPNGVIAHRFWQRGGGYDRNLRSDRDIHQKIQYVHNNPVRRNLVTKLEDWAWSSWHDYQDRPGLLPLDRGSLPVLEG